MSEPGKELQLTLWTDRWRQVAHHRGSLPQGAKPPPCSDAERALLDNLWELIRFDLQREALHPYHSWISDVLVDRVVHLFELVMIQLLAGQVPLDNPRQLPGLLRKVARRRAIDEYRKLFGRPKKGRATSSRSHDSKESAPPRIVSLELLANLVDVASPDREDNWVARLENETLEQLVVELWSKLPYPDDLIMQLRWDETPPRPFLSIAKHLGPGWTEATVRKRHQRVLEKTRERLREEHTQTRKPRS